MKRRHFLAAASSLPLAACQRPMPAIEGGFVGVNMARGHLLRPDPSLPALPAPSRTRRTRVLILGGGVAGLAAARALRLRGLQDVALLELEDTAGGNSRSGQIKGLACPLGAHYLPVPSDKAAHVQDLLEELGLRQRVAGRWVYDERHLCHSPQERLFIRGEWQEGLLPHTDLEPAALTDYRRFAQKVQDFSRTIRFQLPVSNSPLEQMERALDAMTFEAWLGQNDLHSPALRWYLDYCCRDDYGTGLAGVSAWAGIHYFASRHGFQAPGVEPPERDAGVLTWPGGNGWLTQRLAAPLGERLHTGRVVMRVAQGKHGAEVDVLNAADHSVERWQAEHCILALPLFVAARVLLNPLPALQQAAAALRYAPWLVANLHIGSALHDRPGAAPSWDNVLYNDGDRGRIPGLGYVDAMHQSLQSVPGATVLSYYRSFGMEPAERRMLFEKPWLHWRDAIVAELALAHPDLPEKVTQIDVMRYGHAMSVPVPGIRSHPALRALQASLPPPWQRLHVAHSDLSGYSVFEEAFSQGHRCAMALRL